MAYWLEVLKLVWPIQYAVPPLKAGLSVSQQHFSACAFEQHNRVFTKLHIWNLFEYEKILYLDPTTLVVSKRVEALFDGDVINIDVKRPAAMRRGPNPLAHMEKPSAIGERIKARDFNAGLRPRHFLQLRGGVNVGVLLIKPDSGFYQQILRDACVNSGEMSDTPDQTFISRYFLGDWKYLPVSFNYQMPIGG